YQLLREKVTNWLGTVVLDGFSVYEVDGVFRGERFWEQRTLVIRLLLIQRTEKPTGLFAWTIHEIGSEIASRVAVKEEEIWICHYPAKLTVFIGLKRVLAQGGD